MTVQLQDVKTEILIVPHTASAGGTAKGFLDTVGWDHARINVSMGTYASGTHVMAALSLSEATNSAAATGIPAFTGTTNTVTVSGTSSFIIPIGVTADFQGFAFDVDLRKRERYLAINFEAAASALAIVATAQLSRGRAMPGSDAGSMTVEVIG